MPSPFPGMDPYLEAYWGDIHTSLITYARDQLNQSLPADLCARAQEYVRLEADDESNGALGGYNPDVHVEKQTPPEVGSQVTAAATSLAEPLVVPMMLPPVHRSIRILDSHSGDRVVTSVEFLSPSNKIGELGRTAYRKKQHDLLNGGVNLMEIDLLRDGEFVLAVPPENVPAPYREPYRVCVVRAQRRAVAEIYHLPLRQRLPAIRIPLRPSDPDAGLDLQALMEQIYLHGRYQSINYRVDPVPALRGDAVAWADSLLRDKQLRP